MTGWRDGVGSALVGAWLVLLLESLVGTPTARSVVDALLIAVFGPVLFWHLVAGLRALRGGS